MTEASAQPQGLWKTIARATRGRCPNCGIGKLFRAYLKQVEACASCGEAFGHIRADDGPAWLTITIVTHLTAALALLILKGEGWPLWLELSAIIAPSVILMGMLLPRSKGLFIGWIWRTGCTGSEG